MTRHVLWGFLLVVTPLLGHTSPQKAPHPRKDVATIARETKGAVVSIVMADDKGQPIAQGSGFVVTRNGVVVTNYHVIENGTSAVIKLPDGSFFNVDGVLALDEYDDIAVIKAHGNNFRTVALGDSDRLQIGDEVVAIGSPLSLDSTVSNGIVSGVRHEKNKNPFAEMAGISGQKILQITAPISHGSSGGPLFNMAGEVVGITSAALVDGENLNFAVAINDAKRLLRTTDVHNLTQFPDRPNEVAETENPENSPSPKVGQEITFTVNKGGSFDGRWGYPVYFYQIQVANNSAPVLIYCHRTASDCIALKPETTYKAQVMDVHDPNAYERGTPSMRIFGIFDGIPMSTVYVIVIKDK